MKHSRSSRSARNVLAPKLAAYSATAAAALAFAPAAHAQIVAITSFDYPQNSITGSTTPPSLNAFGTQSFVAGIFHGILSFRGGRTLSTARFVGGSGHPNLYFTRIPMRLSLGAPVKASTQLDFPAPILAAKSYSLRGHKGSFVPLGANGAVSGYLRFRGSVNSHSYYGWLKAKVTTDASSKINSVSLVESTAHPGVFGAYEIASAPDINSFVTGQISAVPEPADAAFGLGLLAFGAAGVRELRRRRKVAA
ncbi:MAG TPA: hypothetical protein VHC95_09205 [Opitutales bacterium]|nr:hypothetical protein [Opitutales bacterium]